MPWELRTHRWPFNVGLQLSWPSGGQWQPDAMISLKNNQSFYHKKEKRETEKNREVNVVSSSYLGGSSGGKIDIRLVPIGSK
jgi:hypothetical protein